MFLRWLVAVIVVLGTDKIGLGDGMGARPEESLLQIVHSPGRDICYKVRVRCDYNITGKLSFSLHEVKNLRLQVVRYGLGYTDEKVLMDRQFDSKWSHEGTTTSVLWDCGIAFPSCLLPSGRVFITADAQVYFVMFDGDRCTLFRLNSRSDSFEVQETVPENLRKDLRQLYQNSFSPEDAYWSYALVKNAGWFGFKVTDTRLSEPPIDTSDNLYRKWKASVER